MSCRGKKRHFRGTQFFGSQTSFGKFLASLLENLLFHNPLLPTKLTTSRVDRSLLQDFRRGHVKGLLKMLDVGGERRRTIWGGGCCSKPCWQLFWKVRTKQNQGESPRPHAAQDTSYRFGQPRGIPPPMAKKFWQRPPSANLAKGQLAQETASIAQ